MTSMGTGVFTLHKNFMRIGIINASLLLLAIAYLLYYASKIVIDASKKNPEVHSLPELAEKLLGYKMKLIYNIVFTVFMMINGLGGFLAFSKCFYQNFHEYVWRIIKVDE